MIQGIFAALFVAISWGFILKTFEYFFGIQQMMMSVALKGLDFWSQLFLGVVIKLLAIVRILSDYILFPVVKFAKSGNSRRLPKPKNELVMLSAKELAEKIMKQEVSSVDVVTAFIERIREVNGSLNAVTDERFIAALQDAKAADAEILQCAGDPQSLNELQLRKPFLGIPITTKNALAVKDLGNESGLYLRRGMKATEDSPAMASMRKAGAIPIAVTNTPELCLWIESNNTIFGRTCNPYDFGRTSGGSSGGEGSIIAACGSPLGIGTDIAGSIRVPSAYNGLFGLKPTINTVSIVGHWPMPKDILHPLLIAGPMSKSAKDLRPVLETLVGPELALKMKLSEKVNLQDFKVYYIEDFESPIIPSVTDEIRRATRSVALHLASMSGSRPKKTHYNILKHSLEIYIAYLGGAKCPSFAQELTMLKSELQAGKELVKYFANASEHTFPSIMVANLEKLTKNRKDHRIIRKFIEMSRTLESQMEQTLTDSIIVCPTLPDVAPHHGMTILRPGIMAYTGIWNILGFPAVNVPIGLSEEGMPIGVTIVAGKHRDRVCCEAAIEIEKKFGGWVPPF